MKSEVTEKELNKVAGGTREDAANLLYQLIKNGDLHPKICQNKSDEEIKDWAYRFAGGFNPGNKDDVKYAQNLLGNYYNFFVGFLNS